MNSSDLRLRKAIVAVRHVEMKNATDEGIVLPDMYTNKWIGQIVHKAQYQLVETSLKIDLLLQEVEIGDNLLMAKGSAECALEVDGELLFLVDLESTPAIYGVISPLKDKSGDEYFPFIP